MYNTIDLFAGAGGLSIGLEQAGFEHILLNEIDRDAVKTLRTNRPDWEVAFQDVKTLNLEEYYGTIDLISGGFPCFVAGTKVLTKTGYKNIEDIKKGEYVLTHKNRFKKVLVTMINTTEDVYKINATCLVDLYTTKEHPFYVIQRKKEQKNFINSKGIRSSKIIYTIDEPKWKNAEDLEKGDFLGYSINKKKVIPKWKGINSKLNQKNTIIKNNLEKHMNNKDFWWFVGRYIADGWLVNSKRKDRKNSYVWKTIICAGHKEELEIENGFNKLGLHYTKVKERTTFKYIFANEELFKFLNQFKRLAHGKELNHIIYDLPINLLEYFIEGYLSGDGSFNKDTKEYSFNTVSEKLAYGLQNIIHKVYRTPCKLGIYKHKNKTKIIEGRTVNVKDTFYAKFFKDINRTNSFIKNNIIWSPFKYKEILEKETSVYNFEVEDDNSYTANNAIVHNCQSFSHAGKRLGLDDTRGTLFYELARLVKQVQPKMFLVENVKGLLSHDNGKTLETIVNVFEDVGYHVFQPKILKAVEFKVPQKRERLFLIGVRKDLYKSDIFEWPVGTSKMMTVGDALFKGELYDSDVPKSPGQRYSPKKIKVMKLVPEGGNWRNLPLKVQKSYMLTTFYAKGGRTGIAKRLSFEQPSPTILCSPSQKQTERCHPKEDRPLTVRESARLQTFPDDWIFSGPVHSQYRQVGNAVAINLSYEIGLSIIKHLKILES